MKRKVLVLGGHGMLGEALKRISENFSEFEFSFPTKDSFDVRGFKGNLDAEIVIDMVPSPPPRKFPEITRDDYHQRFTTTHSDFMSYALKAGIKRYIFISSGGAVYGRSKEKIPHLETDVLGPVSFYGESKMILENHLIKETSLIGSTFVIIRPSNVFNAIEESPLHTGLIGVVQQKINAGEAIEILGDEKQNQKDYVSNIDVADAILKTLNLGDNQIFNVGTGKTLSIHEIIQSLEKKLGKNVQRIHRPEVANDITWACLDIKKAKDILSYSPKLDFHTWLKQKS